MVGTHSYKTSQCTLHIVQDKPSIPEEGNEQIQKPDDSQSDKIIDSSTNEKSLSCKKENIIGSMFSKGLETVPPCLKILEDALHAPLDSKCPANSRPIWLDDELLLKGRKFAMKYLFGLVYSEMLSLAMLFSFRGSLEALMYTGNSDTPYSAFRRYLSTVTRIISWYESDAWQEGTEAYCNMMTVRKLHNSVSKRMNETPREILEQKISLERRGRAMWCPYISELKKDFSLSPGSDTDKDPENGRKIFINQLDMSITQFGFVGLMILYPERFGAHGATEEELEGFVHLWRGLGHLLGIEDRYNFCRGGLKVTRERSKEVIEKWVKPSMSRITFEWEHMFRCVVEGISYYVPGNTFGGAMAYLCWVIGQPTPQLHAIMSWKEWFYFNLHRYVLCFVLKMPGAIVFHNWLIKSSLKRARTASPSWHKKKKEKVYDYQKKILEITHL